MEPRKEAPLPEYYSQKEYTLLPFSAIQNPIPNYPIYIDPASQNPNSDPNFQNVEKAKRHRRGKNEINDRNYRCPDCDKCYLSGPALTTHRKTKHGYGINGEKRARGRPKKECLNENICNNNPQNKFIFFFGEEHRKISEEQEIINLDIIKQYITTIFKQCKESLFNDIESVEKYEFYNFIEENWDKEEPDFIQECYSSGMDGLNTKIQTYNIDCVFFLYLKEFYKFINEKYFWFILKFIILFRECLNQSKKNILSKNEENKAFCQLYSAEIVPEMCNEFLLDFMEPYDYYGLNKDELIELIQHFCYWLNIKQYTQFQLSLINGK